MGQGVERRVYWVRDVRGAGVGVGEAHGRCPGVGGPQGIGNIDEGRGWHRRGVGRAVGDGLLWQHLACLYHDAKAHRSGLRVRAAIVLHIDAEEIDPCVSRRGGPAEGREERVLVGRVVDGEVHIVGKSDLRVGRDAVGKHVVAPQVKGKGVAGTDREGLPREGTSLHVGGVLDHRRSVITAQHDHLQVAAGGGNQLSVSVLLHQDGHDAHLLARWGKLDLSGGRVKVEAIGGRQGIVEAKAWAVGHRRSHTAVVFVVQRVGQLIGQRVTVGVDGPCVELKGLPVAQERYQGLIEDRRVVALRQGIVEGGLEVKVCGGAVNDRVGDGPVAATERPADAPVRALLPQQELFLINVFFCPQEGSAITGTLGILTSQRQILAQN